MIDNKIIFLIFVIAFYYFFIRSKESFTYTSIQFNATMPVIAFVSCKKIPEIFPSMSLTNYEKKLSNIYKYCLSVISYNKNETVDKPIFTSITKSYNPYIIRVLYSICSQPTYINTPFSQSFRKIVETNNFIENWAELGCKVQSTTIDPLTGGLKIVYTSIADIPDYQYYDYTIINGKLSNYYSYLSNKYINNINTLYTDYVANNYVM